MPLLPEVVSGLADPRVDGDEMSESGVYHCQCSEQLGTAQATNRSVRNCGSPSTIAILGAVHPIILLRN